MCVIRPLLVLSSVLGSLSVGSQSCGSDRFGVWERIGGDPELEGHGLTLCKAVTQQRSRAAVVCLGEWDGVLDGDRAVAVTDENFVNDQGSRPPHWS